MSGTPHQKKQNLAMTAPREQPSVRPGKNAHASSGSAGATVASRKNSSSRYRQNQVSSAHRPDGPVPRGNAKNANARRNNKSRKAEGGGNGDVFSAGDSSVFVEGSLGASEEFTFLLYVNETNDGDGGNSRNINANTGIDMGDLKLSRVSVRHRDTGVSVLDMSLRELQTHVVSMMKYTGGVNDTTDRDKLYSVAFIAAASYLHEYIRTDESLAGGPATHPALLIQLFAYLGVWHSLG